MKRYRIDDFGNLIPDDAGNVVLYSDVAPIERKASDLDAALTINMKTTAHAIEDCATVCDEEAGRISKESEEAKQKSDLQLSYRLNVAWHRVVKCAAGIRAISPLAHAEKESKNG